MNSTNDSDRTEEPTGGAPATTSGLIRSWRTLAAIVGAVALLAAGAGAGLVALIDDEPARDMSHEGIREWHESNMPGVAGPKDRAPGGGDREMGAMDRMHDRMRDGVAESGGPRELLSAAAEILGVDADELVDALRGGKSIADVASENGVQVQDVVDALVAKVTSEANERISDLVNRKPGSNQE